MSETQGVGSQWARSLGQRTKTFLQVLGSLRRIAIGTRLYDELSRFSDRDLAALGTSRADVARFVVQCVERSIDDPGYVPDRATLKAAARRSAVDVVPAAEPLRHAA